MIIDNPVLRGFHPDPSMIRVGDTYYIASSTFEWFPGVRIHSSKDMVHWQYVTSILDSARMIDMRGDPSSGGVWAPDLSYADGYFWLVFSDIKMVTGAFKDGVNYLTRARSIEGPWSDPIPLNYVGFDASLFHDGDGRKYLIQQTWDHREYHHHFDGITLTQFDTESMRLMSETARTIWRGTQVKLAEGPHLYRIRGWYYLFASEGGTTYSHQETVSRSKTLDELSFQTMPGCEPFLSNFDTPRSYLQKQGHGSLVETPGGEWYYASLCGRPWHRPQESIYDPRGWCTLGRETSIQKVVWDREGWPHIEGGHGGRRFVQAPRETIDSRDRHSCHQHDEFESEKLGPDWNTLRVPFDKKMGTVGEGSLRLWGQGSLHNLFDLSLVARRWQAFNFDAQVRVNFHPQSYQAMAGLTNYYNDANFSWVFITWDERRQTRVIEVAESNRNDYTSYLQDEAIPVPAGSDVWLRTQVRTSTYSYQYSFDGVGWLPTPVVLDAAILSDDYVHQTSDGYFTGAFVGLAAVDYSGYRSEAAFHSFDYKEHEGSA